MKVLVTGATGGLGRLVIEQLLQKGHEVIGTSRSIVKAQKLDFFHKITFIPHDINRLTSIDLYSYFGKPDTMIHLAWEKLDDYKNDAHLTTILESHKAFISNFISNGLKNFNGVGTCYEYGLREGELDETLEAQPTLPYPQAKNALREFIESLKNVHSFSSKWIRLFYVFGEIHERKNLYTHLMAAINQKEDSFNMSGGEQIRDFLSPNQIAEQIVQISLQTKTQGIINSCSGKPVKLRDFITDFLSQNNYKINLNLGYFPYPTYEPMETWGSVKKLNKIITQE